MEPIAEEVKIGTHNEWEIFFKAAGTCYVGRKGRKRREESHLTWLFTKIDNEDKAEIRKAHRAEPCTFRFWDSDKEIDIQVEITSYSARGLGVKPTAGGEVDYLKLGGYGGWGADRERSVLPIVPNKADVGPLLRAVDALRKAKENLRKVYQSTVIEIPVKWTTGDDVDKFFAEEDRLRAEINKVNR